MTLEAGTRVAERYRIVGPLGQGGMGVVYRARDEKLGRQVALKTLAKERIGDARARARLLREARSAAALEHPGIAQVYDVGETEDGGAFLVMELVRGHSLRDLMKTGAIEQGEVLEVIEQVAKALDHAHAQGVIHRDVKPDNVMVRPDGRAVLLDFGLAKDLGPAVADTVARDTPDAEPEHLTKEGTLLGTLSYLAPEQARGREVGPRSDQFALAATAYEALTGRLPWTGREATAVLAQILMDEAPPPSSLDESLPPSFDAVFARGLAKDPEDRFADASAFARALREASRAPEAQVEPPPTGAAPTRGTPRSALPVIAALGVALGGAIAVALLWDHGAPDPPPPPTALAERAVIGCPVLEARGVEAPAGWLGAMAADLACRRLTLHLGGDPRRAREPAELLQLPRVAVDGFPADPYVQPEVRERTLTAAEDLGGWVDGTVRRREDGSFAVSLGLHAPGATEPLAEASGEGEALYVAVDEAVDALARDEALPAREAIDPDIAPWLGASDLEIALGYEALGESVLTGVGIAEHCRDLIARAEDLGPLRGEVGRVCARFRVEGAGALERPELDRSSLGALALTAAEHADRLPESDVRDLADQLAEARLAESRPYARATLARGEILLHEQLGEMDRARDLLLTAPEDHPEDWFLRVHLVRAMRRTSGVVAATRAAAAWHPGTPEAWRTLALPIRRDRERALPWLRRAYLSGGSLPLTGIQLADALLRDDAGRDEVRAIAARYATGGERGRLAGEYLRARVEITEAQLGAALERLQRSFARHDRFGRLVDGDADAMIWLLDLTAVLERGPEVADPLVRRYVLAEPHRLDIGQPHYEVPMIRLCTMASQDVASACLEKLRALREGRAARAGRVDGAEELLEGALHHVRGEAEAAVRAWRPLVRTRGSWLPPEPFEQTGETALLERLVEAQLRRDDLAGARPVHAEEAARAAARGDDERARELAQRVVDAWAVADVEVPAVARMERLLTGLGAGSSTPRDH